MDFRKILSFFPKGIFKANDGTLKEKVNSNEEINASVVLKNTIKDSVFVERAKMNVKHIRNGIVLNEQNVENVKTNVGIVQYHLQCFGNTGLSTNGTNFIALSADALTETSSSVTLSNEIVINGLARAAGTVVLASGSGTTTTISHTFTATGTQSAQKAALFNASSGGVINHVLNFSTRSLLLGDQLAITFSIGLS
jgi:hypothetical protein